MSEAGLSCLLTTIVIKITSDMSQSSVPSQNILFLNQQRKEKHSLLTIFVCILGYPISCMAGWIVITLESAKNVKL